MVLENAFGSLNAKAVDVAWEALNGARRIATKDCMKVAIDGAAERAGIFLPAFQAAQAELRALYGNFGRQEPTDV